MNHLAHIYLSRHSEKMMVGNFIADGIKGKSYAEFEPEIAHGILMHREIDTFTDSHALVRHSKSFFREKYGLYSGVLVDLFYDHFLAKNWKKYSTEPLSLFSERAYRIFEKFLAVMPDAYQHMFPYMQRENWLLNYAQLEGIQRSLNGMSRRIARHPGIERSIPDLKNHYEEVEQDFFAFFPELENHVAGF